MKYYIMVLVAIALTGCASIDLAAVTPYQSGSGFNLRGGYTEKKISDTTYEVTFTGNGFASEKMVGDFAIMRGAELCQMAGFPYFKFANGTMTQNRIYTNGIPSNMYTAVANIECVAEPDSKAQSTDKVIAATKALWQQYIPEKKAKS